MGNRETPIVLAILVLEDLVMAGFLPLVTLLQVGGGTAKVVFSVGVAALLVVVVLAVAARYGPAISRAVFSHSDEALLFGILAVLLLTAGATQALNVSAAVGAFLAGIAFSGPAADRARSLLVPLRSVFAGTFFLFFGFQVDPGTIPQALPAAAALALVGGVTKAFTGWLAGRRAGIGPRGRTRAAVGLIARGEFSIVIAGSRSRAAPNPISVRSPPCTCSCSRSRGRSWLAWSTAASPPLVPARRGTADPSGRLNPGRRRPDDRGEVRLPEHQHDVPHQEPRIGGRVHGDLAAGVTDGEDGHPAEGVVHLLVGERGARLDPDLLQLDRGGVRRLELHDVADPRAHRDEGHVPATGHER